MKTKLSLLLVLLSVLFSCDEYQYIRLAEVRPVLRAGFCEVITSGLDSENEALQEVEDLKNDLTSFVVGDDYLYIPTNEAHGSYGVNGQGAWFAWVEYDCNGAAVSTLILSPVQRNQASEKLSIAIRMLEEDGNAVIQVDEREIYSDEEGTFIVYTIYFYRDDNTDIQVNTSALSSGDNEQSLTQILNHMNELSSLRFSRN